jgi:DNA polymerase-4
LEFVMPQTARFRALKELPSAEVRPVDACASILHVDMDAFFVSVELLERPELRGKPVVVGGSPDQRGVVSAASYEARRYGIQSAMPLRTAGRLCPHAIFLDGNHRRYEEWSDRIATILRTYSPTVEMASIDEAYLDLSGTERLHGPPPAAAHKLLREITATTGLPCSGGLARTRLAAKVASEQGKPRGLLWVPAGAEERFLAPLSVRKIPGIGKVTEEALRRCGIETVGMLAAVSLEQLEAAFGKWGTALYRKSRGEDSFEFVVDGEPKSISQNHTFGEDTAEREMLTSTLSFLGQKAAGRLREAALHCRTVGITLRFKDFRTITRSRTLAEPAQVDEVLLAAMRALFEQAWDGKSPLRLVGVALTNFTGRERQFDLLDTGRMEKLERLAQATDALRDRFGFGAIQRAGAMRPPNSPARGKAR